MKIKICGICGRVIDNNLMFELFGYNYCVDCKKAIIPLVTPQEEKNG